MGSWPPIHVAQPRPSPIARAFLSSFPRKREPRDLGPRRSPPCLSQGQALGPRLRGCDETDHGAQHRDPEQNRRPHRSIGLLELAGQARGCDDIAGAPDPGAAALAMRDQHRLAETRGDRRGGVADMDHERAPTDRGAVDPFRRQAEIMRDRHRRLAGGRDAVDVGRNCACRVNQNGASSTTTNRTCRGQNKQVLVLLGTS